MSKPPARPLTAREIEQAVSLYQQLKAAVLHDDAEGERSFFHDEDEIDTVIEHAGHVPPREMLPGLIDAAVLLDQKADHLDALRKRYTERRDRYRVRCDRVRATLDQLMAVLGETAAEGDLGSASYVKPRKHVVVPDVNKLPEQFIKRTDPEPRKGEIAAEFRAGRTVEGAEMSSGNEPPSLRITAY
jgi:hypothetical protein